ncbi:MAG TPA: hypothetical protein VG649_21805 [Candidatus Angelobacter sp.]|jgi:hypothetical protein|nr:hypothetical protein [Candidatus Angelobacter sp.]
MHAPKMAHKRRTRRFDPQPKKRCRRFPRNSRSDVEFSEALALCQERDDIVALLCEVLGEKPSYTAIQTAWPWLEKQTKSPCKCSVVHPSVLVTLCHLYDHHVIDRKDWSFSRLLKWARNMQDRFASAKANSGGRIVTRCRRCRAIIRVNRNGMSR